MGSEVDGGAAQGAARVVGVLVVGAGSAGLHALRRYRSDGLSGVAAAYAGFDRL